MKTIGKSIRDARSKAGMTQDDLAEALFVTRQTVSNYETGKSRPDIDTLLRIAQILNTDINTLIYGDNQKEDRRFARKWAIISGITCIILLAAYLVLYFPCKELFRVYYSSLPYFLKLTLRPALIFAFGWFLIHILGMVCHLKPFESKVSRILRIVMYILLGIIAIIPLPYYIWLLVCEFKKFTSTSVSMTFPYIPVYMEAIFTITYTHLKFPFIMAIVGALCRLFGIPFRHKSNLKS